MKKITAIFLAAALALSLAGCNKEDAPIENNSSSTPTSSSTPASSSTPVSSTPASSSDPASSEASSSTSDVQSDNVRQEVKDIMDGYADLCEEYMANTQVVIATFIANCEADPNYLNDETSKALMDAMTLLENDFNERSAAYAEQGEAIGDLTDEEKNHITDVSGYYNSVLAAFNEEILNTVAEWVSAG